MPLLQGSLSWSSAMHAPNSQWQKLSMNTELHPKFGAFYCHHSYALVPAVCASIHARTSNMFVETATKKWVKTSHESVDYFSLIECIVSLIDLSILLYFTLNLHYRLIFSFWSFITEKSKIWHSIFIITAKKLLNVPSQKSSDKKYYKSTENLTRCQAKCGSDA